MSFPRRKNRKGNLMPQPSAAASLVETKPSRYRWFILALLTAVGAFAAAIPASCMPPLFKEIADDLGLNLVDIGMIWGVASLAGLFVSILGGILSDRLNVKLFIGIYRRPARAGGQFFYAGADCLS